MATPNQKAHHIELHGEEEDKGQLHYGYPSVSIADAFPEIRVVLDSIPGHEVDNHGPVAQKDYDSSQRRRRSPSKTDSRYVQLRMAHLAGNGGCGSPRLADMIPRSRGMFYRGFLASL